MLTEKHTSRDYRSQENPDVPLALCLTLDTEIQTEPFLTLTYYPERKVQVAFYFPKICEQPHFKLKVACLLISCFQTLRGVTDRRRCQQLPSSSSRLSPSSLVFVVNKRLIYFPPICAATFRVCPRPKTRSCHLIVKRFF